MFEVDEMEGCHSCMYGEEFDTEKEPCKYCYGFSLYTKKETKMSDYEQEPTTRNDLGVREFEEIEVAYPPEELCTYPEYKGKPYFGIKYRENGEEIVGYGTYKPKVLSQYLKDYFIPTTKNDLGVETTQMIDKSNFSQEQYKTDLQSAYDSGFEAGKKAEQEPRWIPVSERLPEPVNVGALWKREVLITGYLSFDDKKKRFVATELIDNVISKKDVNDIHVIAWMPLPAPFEPQESEDT